MKLLEIAKRGSGRVAVMQFTLSELLSIIALYETLIKNSEGRHKEKKMLGEFNKIVGLIESLTYKNQDYRNYSAAQGKVFYKASPYDKNDPFLN
jgi:hypothetical protein